MSDSKPHSELVRAIEDALDAGMGYVGAVPSETDMENEVLAKHDAAIPALRSLVEQLEAYETALREIELASRKPDTAPGHFGYIARVVLPESNDSEPHEA